jgi:transposase
VLAALVVSLRAELAEADAAELLEAAVQRGAGQAGAAVAADEQRAQAGRAGRHKGQTLAQVARPDREVRHEPGCCGWCGAVLAGRPVTGVERRQVFDLPPVRAEVTEHQLIGRECACGHRTKAAAPGGAGAPACYGPRIAAVIVYLYIGQFLSKTRTAQALAELFGLPLSPGTVSGLTSRAAGKLGGFLEHAREQAGWHGVFVRDHARWQLELAVADPWITLAAVATATQRVRLEPMVTPLARQRPVKPAPGDRDARPAQRWPAACAARGLGAVAARGHRAPTPRAAARGAVAPDFGHVGAHCGGWWRGCRTRRHRTHVRCRCLSRGPSPPRASCRGQLADAVVPGGGYRAATRLDLADCGPGPALLMARTVNR